MLNRRELLTTFLGAAALPALGCRGPVADIADTTPGELVGADFTLGHHLRDLRTLPVVPDDRWQETDVAIVGAGVAGLSAARKLHRAGVKLQVLELEREPGGTSRSGSAYPWGAHYLPAPMDHQTDLIELLGEMDLLEGVDDEGQPIVGEQHFCRDPHERLYFRGHWTEGLYLHDGATREDQIQLAKFQALIDQWVDWRDSDGRRAFGIPMAQCSRDAVATDLDKITMADWLRKHELNSERLWWLVNYSCRDDYGLTVEQTSAWAGLFYFCARIRKSGHESQSFITWPEGNARLVRQLAKGIEDSVATSRAVVDIAPVGEGSDEKIELLMLDENRKAFGLRARAVVFAAPRFLAKYVIRPWRKDPPSHISAFEYGSWMVANIHLNDRPQSRGFPLCWDNVMYDSPSLGYVVSTHQTDEEYGATTLTYYYPLCDESPAKVREKLLGTGQPEWAEIAISDLARAHVDFRPLVERVDVMRWGHAMIRPKPGFIQGPERPKAEEPFRNIYFSHSDMSGLPLFEEAFYRGNRAAATLLEDLALGAT